MDTEDDDTTKPRQFRVPNGMWAAYDTLTRRVFGQTRAERLVAHIRRDIQRYGDDDEKRLLREALAEMRRRRARRGRRSPS